MPALPAAERPAVLTELRARIAAPRVHSGFLAAELPELESWMGGWPQPGVSEIIGPVGSGRLALLLLALRAVWVVRPGPERAAWVAEQASAAGSLAAVVLLDALRLEVVGQAGG